MGEAYPVENRFEMVELAFLMRKFLNCTQYEANVQGQKVASLLYLVSGLRLWCRLPRRLNMHTKEAETQYPTNIPL